MHNAQADGDMYNDQTDGDLHNDQTYFDIENLQVGTFGVEIKVEIKNYPICVYMLYHTPFSLRVLFLAWKIEDRDGG